MMKFTIGLLLGLSLASALAGEPCNLCRLFTDDVGDRDPRTAQVDQPAATNPCRLVLRDNAVVMNAGLYNLAIETQGENVIFEGNDVTFAGEPCEQGACRDR